MIKLQSHIQYDPFRNLFVATLLGGEFHNAYGQGVTVEDAKTSLKIRYWQLKLRKPVEKKG